MDRQIPQVYLGETRCHRYLRAMQERGFGRLFAVSPPRPAWSGEPRAIDNGVFGAWRRKEKWDEVAYLRYVERAARFPAPTFAVAPDVVAGGMRSADLSASWVERLPAEWPLYFVVQDNMTAMQVRPYLAPFAGVFLGGTDAFKVTAPTWSYLARCLGKKFHYGRASTDRRIAHAVSDEVHADSLDTSQPLWRRDYFSHFLYLMDRGGSVQDAINF